MDHITTQARGAVKLYLRCPACGSADLASIEQLTASCQGHATLTIETGGELRAEFHPGGWTDINWYLLHHGRRAVLLLHVELPRR